MELSGKTVVYVGGYGGIGFACCQQLLAQGIQRLVIVDLKPDGDKLRQLKQLNTGTKVEYQQLDLRAGQQVIATTIKQIATQWGPIDVLINGGGILNEPHPRLTVEVNLLGLIETTLATVPLMSKANGGRGGVILNIASVLGLEPGSCFATYTATKHGVLGFTRACADPLHYTTTGVAHITVCPGPTVSNLLGDILVGTFDFSQPLVDKALSSKFQSAEECAQGIVHILQQATNGSVWIVDLGKLEQVSMHKYWEYTY